MKNRYGSGGGYELDIPEIMFLIFSGLFILFYFADSGFKYFINSFYFFIWYVLRIYPVVSVMYAVNLFLFLTGLHGVYILIFETRLTGSKLKMHDKLEKYREKEKNGRY
ncbi:hypothetical protein ACMCNP_00535 [Candidatus Acidulodesulfobacterium sp. H_13]|uniref:hypothetical protein n=1 Tax=Candidatus Acidulodesulfobacterium sp. H_13 TaxID=3395470 RepID=UPI003AF4C729